MADCGWLCQDQEDRCCGPHQQCLMGLTGDVYQRCLMGLPSSLPQQSLMGLTSSLSWARPAVSHGPHQQCLIQVRIWHGPWTGAAWPDASSSCSSSWCTTVGLPNVSPLSQWLKVVTPSCKQHVAEVRWAQMPGDPEGGPAGLCPATGYFLPPDREHNAGRRPNFWCHSLSMAAERPGHN